MNSRAQKHRKEAAGGWLDSNQQLERTTPGSSIMGRGFAANPENRAPQ
jgi:hypothetical protein